MAKSPQKQKWSPDQFLAFVAHIRKDMLTVSGGLLCYFLSTQLKSARIHGLYSQIWAVYSVLCLTPYC